MVLAISLLWALELALLSRLLASISYAATTGCDASVIRAKADGPSAEIMLVS